MRPPRFSIIIPAFNAERYIERCLNSLSRQTFCDFEVIVVNDGSVDKTARIVQGFKEKNMALTIQLYSQANSGVSPARNYGLSKASGEWVVFLDADDELPNDALATYFRALSENVDMIMGGYIVLDSNGEVTYSIPDRIEMRLDRDTAIRLMYAPIMYRYLGYIAGKCYRRENINNWGLKFNTNIYFNEDRLFTTQYLCKSSHVLYFTKPVYHYYEHSGSVMASLQTRFNPKFMTDLNGFVEMKKSIKQSGSTKELLILADKGIVSSYNRIKTQLNIHNANALSYLFQLHKMLLKGLGVYKYLTFLIKIGLAKFSRL